jgi:N-acetyl sugar amidotransferase
MATPIYQICQRCVMDTTDPDIVFDNDGNCNHCTNYLENLAPQSYQGAASDQKLREIIAAIQKSGQSRKYDCIIGISGGVDSCYSAYLAKELGLRALLVHLDNGWNSEIAVRNIQKMCIGLGFDYETVVLDWNEFRQIQLSFLKSSLVDLEMPTDLAIPAALHQIAAKYNVKYIFSGGNYVSEGILPLQWGYHVMKDMKLYNYIVKTFGSVKREKTPVFGIRHETYYKLVKGIKTVYLLNYVPYNITQAKQLLEKEFGCNYSIGKHHESRYTRFWQTYIMPVKYNFDYRKATLSNQICSNQTTREIALSQLPESPYAGIEIEKERAFICKKLGISIDQFESFMAMKPLTYKDFPNDEKWINFIFRIYKFMFPNKRL